MSKRILIVSASSGFIRENVADLQYNFVAMNTSAGAYDWLSKAHKKNELPDAIICDLELLEGDAYALFGNIQKIPELRVLPFIIISKNHTHLDKIKALESGIDDFYSLPFKAEDLHRRIDFLQSFKKEKETFTPSDDHPLSFNSNGILSKRLFDIVVSMVALIILSPLLLLIALIIKLESRGPVFYISKRVGTGYRIFDFYKFRSMRQGADKELDKLKHLNQYKKSQNGKSNGAVFEDASFVKISNDPRVTTFGNFLRNTSLDELPQLINVLNGDMSIVGNRPLPLYEAEQLTKDVWAKRFMAPAGITGLWQVTKRGRKEMSIAERMELDVAYAKEYSLWLDFKIIMKTIPALMQEEKV